MFIPFETKTQDSKHLKSSTCVLGDQFANSMTLLYLDYVLSYRTFQWFHHKCKTNSKYIMPYCAIDLPPVAAVSQKLHLMNFPSCWFEN